MARHDRGAISTHKSPSRIGDTVEKEVAAQIGDEVLSQAASNGKVCQVSPTDGREIYYREEEVGGEFEFSQVTSALREKSAARNCAELQDCCGLIFQCDQPIPGEIAGLLID